MSKPLTVYLCGQKAFGAATLEMMLHAGYHVAGVSAPREGSTGRADALWAAAGRFDVPRLTAGELRAELLPDGVDLIVCAHSHDFVGRRTREKTRLGGIGYHPSLLPLHRGRDAIRWSLKMNERITGGSVYWLSDVVDGGPIAAQDWCFIRRNDDALSLWKRELFPLGLRLFNEVLSDIARDIIVQIPQDEALATWEPSFNPPPLKRPDLLALPAPGQPRITVATTRHDAAVMRAKVEG